MKNDPPRLLIYIVAGAVDSRLGAVLARIPRQLFVDLACEVLIIDDPSVDRSSFLDPRPLLDPAFKLRIFRNEYQHGSVGNQKVAYAYAIREGFDLIAILRTDGSHAPEELPRLIEPLRSGLADAVIGSRMMNGFGAARAGMPLPRFVGNTVLNWLQNRILGTRFSDLPSGYRAYSTQALAAIPFRLNSNDLHFDTEVTIQLLNAKSRIVELPIPSYSRAEITLAGATKYAWNVVRVTIKSLVHRLGLLYERRFDTSPDDSHYALKLGYPSSHTVALDSVPSGARVVDLGAGPGGFAAELKRKGCEVTVVDQHVPREAAGMRVVVQDLNQPLTLDLGEFEYIVMLDIIEHLHDPEDFVDRVRACFDHRPRTLLLTTANVAFIVTRLMLFLAGQFNYGKAGILDRTHTRLFTFGTILRLLDDAGFRVEEIRGVPAPFPLVFGDGKLARFLLAVNQLLIRISASWFSYQIFVRASSTPTTDFLLADWTARSAWSTDLEVVPRSSRPHQQEDAEDGEQETDSDTRRRKLEL